MAKQVVCLLSSLMLHVALTEASTCSLSLQQLIDLENCCTLNYNICNESSPRCNLMNSDLFWSTLRQHDSMKGCIDILNGKNHTEDRLSSNIFRSQRVNDIHVRNFNNESLEIEALSSQNNTIDEEITHFNQSKSMGIFEKCVKSVQAEQQNIYHEKPQAMKRLSPSDSKNQFKSISNNTEGNFTLEWDFERALLDFTFVQNRNDPISLGEILASFAVKHENMDKPTQLCKIVCGIGREKSDWNPPIVYINTCQVVQPERWRLLDISVIILIAFFTIAIIIHSTRSIRRLRLLANLHTTFELGDMNNLPNNLRANLSGNTENNDTRVEIQHNIQTGNNEIYDVN